MNARHGIQVGRSLWTARDGGELVVLQTLSVVFLTVGYIGTSGTLRIGQQVPWVDLAAAGLVLSGLEIMRFMTTARRRIGLRRLSLFGDVVPRPAATRREVSATPITALVTTAAMTRYHDAGCPLVTGKAGIVAGTALSHEESGQRPCELCLAGGAS